MEYRAPVTENHRTGQVHQLHVKIKGANILTVGEPYAKHGVAKHFEG